jgi:hypothetical protein
LSEEERQKIKDLLFILEKFNISESAKRELTVFCDGLPHFAQCRATQQSSTDYLQVIKTH